MSQSLCCDNPALLFSSFFTFISVSLLLLPGLQFIVEKYGLIYCGFNEKKMKRVWESESKGGIEGEVVGEIFKCEEKEEDRRRDVDVLHAPLSLGVWVG